MNTTLTITYGPDDRPIKLSLSPVIADKVEVSIERISVNSTWIDAKEASLIIDHLKKEFGVDQWIPVTERLPEERKMVMVYHYRGEAFARFKHGCFFYDDGLEKMNTVTHWHPLPDAPSSVPQESQSASE